MCLIFSIFLICCLYESITNHNDAFFYWHFFEVSSIMTLSYHGAIAQDLLFVVVLLVLGFGSSILVFVVVVNVFLGVSQWHDLH